MNKKLFLLPLLAVLLVGCGGNNGGGDNPPVVVPGDGTLANPWSATEAIAQCDLAGESNIVGPDKIVYVTGVCGDDSSFDSKYSQYQGSLDGTAFKFNSATLADGVTLNGNIVGKKIVLEGYLELFEGVYKMGYLPASASPTGAKFTPKIVKIENGTTGGDEGGGGTTGGDEGGGGTITGNEKTVTFDFTTAPSGAPTAWSDSSKNTFAASINGYAFSITNACFRPADQYITDGCLNLCAKKASSASMIANVAALPGSIKSVSFVMPNAKDSSSVSPNAPFVCEFGSSAFTAPSTKAASEGKTGGAGQTVTFNCSVAATYFSISVIQTTNSNGKAAWYNGMIKSLTVTYVA